MIEGLQPYSGYKESGQRWLGHLPSSWKVLPLCRIAAVKSECGRPDLELLSVYLNRGVIRYSESGGQVHKPSLDLSKYQVVDPGDFVLNNQQAWRGSIGVSRYRGIISPAYVIMKLSPRLHPEYANFMFRSPAMVAQWVVASRGVGDIQRNLFYPDLRGSLVPVPPPDEQAGIVRFLEHANRKIDGFIRAKRKLIGLLNEQKQAIIHRAVTRGLDPHAPLKPSGIPWLGDIPKHWETRRIRFCIKGKLAYGANEAAEFDNPDWPRYLRITDFRSNGTLKPDTFRSLPPHIAKDYPVQDGDILFARSGATVGKAFLVRTDTANACYAGYLIRARPRPDVVLPEFLFAYTQSLAFARWKDEIFSKATIQNIGADKYSNLVVPIPKVEEQKTILAHVAVETRPLNTVIARAEREIALMQEYRTRLAADVVTGKLDVRPAAAQLREVEVDVADSGADAIDDGEELEQAGADD
ncbi:MAG: restriction endonuclease subunit S [Verrucomicrobiales bacterium]|nr:restriction endonuclease subunit S [Verrucomicrobiales bacterium]